MWELELYAVVYAIMIVVFGLGATAFHITSQYFADERDASEWALGSWLLLLGCLLAVVARSQISQLELFWSYHWAALLRSLATTINAYAWMRIWFGFRYYYRQQLPNAKLTTAIFSVFFLLVFSAHPLQLSPAWAVIMISVWIFGGVTMIVWDMCSQKKLRVADRFALFGFFIVGFAWLYRLWIISPGFFLGRVADVDSTADSLVLIVSLVAMITIYLGMTLLVYQRLVDQLMLQASTDPLTGALNRRAFLERSESLFAVAKRDRKPIALVLFDLDFFKRVNDEFGHQVGDRVLKNTVEVCHLTLRQQDVFGRYGGEEFIAVLPDTNREQATMALQRLRERLADQTILIGERELQVTVSIGLTVTVPDTKSLEVLVKEADEALYQAKSQGRNRLVQWREGLASG